MIHNSSREIKVFPMLDSCIQNEKFRKSGQDMYTSLKDKTKYKYKMWIASVLRRDCWSSGGRVVKLLACGARGPGFESRPRHWIFRDWLSPASKSRYGWKIAKSTLILKTTNQTNRRDCYFILACLIRCKCSMKISRNSINVNVGRHLVTFV